MASAISSRSIHIPLEPDTIRLLTIHENDGKLSSTISHHNINDRPVYAAISYRWGEQMGCYLQINGVQHEVSGNVESALHRFHARYTKEMNRNNAKSGRMEGGGSETLMLWIDQICINQSDKEEKAIQIRMMDRIYSQATCVVADIGCLSVGGLDILLGSWLARTEWISLDTAADTLTEAGPELPKHIYQQGIIDAVVEFTQQPYFTRIWMLQEFLLNPVTMFMVDTQTFYADAMSVNAIRAITELLDPSSISGQYKVPLSKSIYGFFLMTGLRTSLNWNFKTDNPRIPRFAAILKWACRLNAADERDKVYGCLALAEPTFRKDFEIDLDEPVHLLSQRVVKALIKHDENVSILRQANFLTHGPQTCSWSLDMNPSRYTTFIDRVIESTNITFFQASGQSSQKMPLPLDLVDSRLPLQGYHIDTIQLLTSPGSLHVSWYSIIQNYYRLIEPELGAAISLSDAFWRTLIQDEIEPSHRERSSYRATLQDGLYYFCYLCKMQDQVQYLWDTALQASVLENAALFERSIERKLLNHRLCLTSKGRLASGLPETASPGDKIVVFLGGDFPFVVRDDLYLRLVGSCYVHGIMDGEAIANLGEPEIFSIV